MSAVLKQPPRYNVAAFLDLIRPRPDDERWELLDGEAVLMAPQSGRHQRIVANLLAHARLMARPRGCLEYPGLGIVNDAADNFAPIPDVVVHCGPPPANGYCSDPLFVAEVLSPSTMLMDRGRKLGFYQTIASLQTILIVAQDRPLVEVWWRLADGWDYAVVIGLSGAAKLPCFDSALPMAEIYANVGLNPDEI